MRKFKGNIMRELQKKMKESAILILWVLKDLFKTEESGKLVMKTKKLRKRSTLYISIYGS